MKIQDSVVIVTGASMGIGREVAKLLGSQGANVILAARSKEKLNELSVEIPGSIVVKTDMTRRGDIKVLIDKTVEAFGRVDILINNAGQGMRAAVESIDLSDYRSIIDLNIFGPLIAMQEVIPVMRKQGGGMILNISSMVSKNYFPYLGAYSSTKYALNALSLTARQELAADNIVVSVFHPKMTATDFGQNARGETYSSSAGRPGMSVDTAEDVAKAILEQIESEDAEMMM
ncbi:MAG: SDR family NAD(P)-dependent oxidoreductase [Patescibacteria group bacterium]